MPTYVLPQPLVFQEFQRNVAVEFRRLHAFLFGPLAQVLRYDDADEKPLILLGTYDHVGTLINGSFKTCYSWPNRPAGAKVDQAYTKAFIDNAMLRFYQEGSANQWEKIAPNKLRHLTKRFATNGAFARDASLLRDVKAGDVITLTAVKGINTRTLYSYVTAVEGEPIAASIGAATAGAGNEPTQAAASSFSAASDNSGQMQIDAISATNYNGLPSGDLVEQYTVTCIVGGAFGTAKLKVTSLSGRDNVAEVTPVDSPATTAIGTRGLTATFNQGSGSAFVVGDTWTINVTQAWDITDALSGGSYVCTSDKTYIVEVTKGGYWGATPQITVTTVDGSDSSGPHDVTLPAGTTTTTSTTPGPNVMQTAAIAIGHCGVTIQFAGFGVFGGLVKGDRFLITATAAKVGAMQTLVLAHNLPSEILLNDELDHDIRPSLYIRKNIEVSKKSQVAGEFNWSQSDTEFCANAGLDATDDSWKDGSGNLVYLPVIKDALAVGTNQLYVQYRAWLADNSTVMGSIADPANLSLIPGALTPDNPLKWALNMALQNNNGQLVYYMSVADPDDDESWTKPLEVATERGDVHGFVPLTRDQEVLNLVQGHVSAMSNELNNRWRVGWFNVALVETQVQADQTTSSNAAIILATTEDDPGTSGTQYTLLRITSGNFQLVTKGIRPGDVVRFQFGADAWGDVSYKEYIVDAVLTEDSLRLVTGTTTAESTPIKVEIWRNLTRDEQAADIAKRSGAWANRRIRSVFPDKIKSGSTEMEGYHLCAALAALAGGVAPHQPLTRLQISGFTDVERVTSLFSRAQLDVMAVAGTWIVTQDLAAGTVFTRHAVTTAPYELIDEREESVGRNVDSISYRFFDQYDPYIGIANATPNILDIIEAETRAVIQVLRRASFTEKLGGQLIDAEITDLRISPVFADRIIVSLSLQVPVALNNIEAHLLINAQQTGTDTEDG